MCAMAENVVPRSIPTALRVLMAQKKVGPMPWVRHRLVSAVFVPQKGKNLRKGRSLNRQSEEASAKALGNDFLGANQLVTPDESALHPHDDSTILFRKIRWFIVDHAMTCAIDAFPRLNLLYVESVQDFDQRMNGVFQIITPLRNAAALPLLLRDGGELFAQSVEMVEEIDQIMDERFLERFVQKIVAILEQFGMKRVKQLLIHTFRVANRSQLFVDPAKLFGKGSGSRFFHLSGDLFQTVQHRVFQTVQTFSERIPLFCQLRRFLTVGRRIFFLDRKHRHYFLSLGAQLLHHDREILLFFGGLIRHFPSQKIS